MENFRESTHVSKKSSVTNIVLLQSTLSWMTWGWLLWRTPSVPSRHEVSIILYTFTRRVHTFKLREKRLLTTKPWGRNYSCSIFLHTRGQACTSFENDFPPKNHSSFSAVFTCKRQLVQHLCIWCFCSFLYHQCLCDATQVPFYDCCTGINDQGLYRVVGVSSKVQKLLSLMIGKLLLLFLFFWRGWWGYDFQTVPMCPKNMCDNPYSKYAKVRLS